MAQPAPSSSPSMAQPTPKSLAFSTRDPHPTAPHTVTGSLAGGVVVSLNQQASEVGAAILNQGGNAVDAAIATTFAIGVVSSYMAGIGGGGFMTVRIPPKNGEEQQVFTINFREKAPAAATPDMFYQDPKLSVTGGLSVGVPGEVLGLFTAHVKWGQLPWKDLIAPSIELAKQWTLDALEDTMIQWYASEMMLNDDAWSAIYTRSGILVRTGDSVSRSNYAKTLQTIADEGPKPFYEGEIAKSLVNTVQKTGGILTLDDFKNYTVKVEQALTATYQGNTLYTTHAPSSAPGIIHMLKLAERYDNSEVDGLTTHRLIEIMKFGYGARTLIGDLDCLHDDAKKDIERIPTQEFADEIAPKITDDTTHPPDYYLPPKTSPGQADHGTSPVSVVDGSGMAVAITSSVNYAYGSQVLDPETGIVLNNQMDDFSSYRPNGPNDNNLPGPNKRPRSSISPTIVEGMLWRTTGKPLQIIISAAGGIRIFSAVYQLLINIIDRKKTAEEAVLFPRFHDDLSNSEIENPYAPNLIKELQKNYGHKLRVLNFFRYDKTSIAETIVISDSEIQAASDPRVRNGNGVAPGGPGPVITPLPFPSASGMAVGGF